MKKIELSRIITFNKLVDSLKLDKLSGKDKYAILKIFRKLKLVGTEFDEFRKDIIDKYISTDECKEALEKSNNGDEEAKKRIDEINTEVNNIIYMELSSEKEIDIDSISEDMFINLIDSNGELKVSDNLLLEEILL